MRKARILVHDNEAGILEELGHGKYQFIYHQNYHGAPISLTMPLSKTHYEFTRFPPFFDGFLPEGIMLEAFLHKYKLDKNDYFGQLIEVGHNLVGAINVEQIK